MRVNGVARSSHAASRWQAVSLYRRSGFAVAEHLGGEGLEGSPLSPGIGGQASFPASLFEEGFAVPVALDGNLGQQ